MINERLIEALFEAVINLIEDDNLPAQDRLDAAELLLEYAYGKHDRE